MVPSDEASTLEERAARRRLWPVVKATEVDPVATPGPTEPKAAWDAVLELTAECYLLAGHDLTPLPRSQWPSRLYRSGDPRPDSNGIY